MILLMGIAGSGKGTQGQLLVEEYGYRVISSGEVTRARANDEQRQRMLSGGLLADDEIKDMLSAVLSEASDLDKVILDGFPRTIPQAEWLLEQAAAGRWQVQLAIHLVASREAVKQRLLARGRVDDNDAAIEKRFDEYQRATEPLLAWLSGHGVTVVNINGERPVEQVNAEIAGHL